MKSILIKSLICSLVIFSITFPTIGQQVKLIIEPSPATVEVGTTVPITMQAIGADNKPIEGGRMIARNLRSSKFVPSSGAYVDSLGNLTGKIPGNYNMVVFWVGPDGKQFSRTYMEVVVTNKPVGKIAINNLPNQIYAGTVIALDLEVFDEMGFAIPSIDISVSTSNKEVASVDELNNLYTHKPGKVSISAKVGSIENKIDFKVVENPVRQIDLSVNSTEARTGDVLHFTASAVDEKKQNLSNVVFEFAVSSSGNNSPGASALIDNMGNFVAETPGIYSVLVSSGNISAKKTVKIVPRNVKRDIELVGRAALTTKRTTDFWVWEGPDGKDYAVHGTLSADGKAYFYNVTNPGNIIPLDSVQVDARNVNDLKINEDGTICVISREGASNRKNGIVILDIKDPSDVKILATYTENLTGGVHNLYVYKNHVYALSAGRKYEIINIEDPTKPYRVSKFEIDNPGRSIHDVMINDGIAYSANWNDGVILVDIGNGVAGGSPSNPVEIARFQVESDATHTVFPYTSSTGQKIVIAGDEEFPVGFDLEEVILPDGHLHFIDFTDIKNPKEIAHYKVPEAGSHNYWVEDDMLYIGYYNGGLRVVDISGEIMGDLYKQGREVSYFLPLDKNGYHPNNAMTWGAMSYKGHIFFSDMNSGLWAVKLSPEQPDDTKVEVK